MSHCDVTHLNTFLFWPPTVGVQVPPCTAAPPPAPDFFRPPEASEGVAESPLLTSRLFVCLCSVLRRHGGSSRTRRKWPDDSRCVCASLTMCRVSAENGIRNTRGSGLKLQVQMPQPAQRRLADGKVTPSSPCADNFLLRAAPQVRETLLHLHSREEESPCWSSGRQSLRFCSRQPDPSQPCAANSFPWISCVYSQLLIR